MVLRAGIGRLVVLPSASGAKPNVGRQLRHKVERQFPPMIEYHIDLNAPR
jgi:hypothetical protein